MLLGPDPAAHQVVPNRVGQGKVVVSFGRDISVLHQGEMEVSIEISFEVSYIFYSRQAADGYLLPLVVVGERLGHASADGHAKETTVTSPGA